MSDAVIELRKKGWTYDAIAHALNMTRSQVAGYIYRAGLTTDSVHSGKSSTPDFRRQVLADTKGSQTEIAKRWGVSQSTVSEWKRGLGVMK